MRTASSYKFIRDAFAADRRIGAPCVTYLKAHNRTSQRAIPQEPEAPSVCGKISAQLTVRFGCEVQRHNMPMLLCTFVGIVQRHASFCHQHALLKAQHLLEPCQAVRRSCSWRFSLRAFDRALVCVAVCAVHDVSPSSQTVTR